MTSAFMHDISRTVQDSDSKAKKNKKKSKHQAVSTSIFMFLPDSKYFKKDLENSCVKGKVSKQERKKRIHPLNVKQSYQIDLKFIMMDTLYTINAAFEKYLLGVLNAKQLMIGESEKKVILTRNSGSSRFE